METTESGGLLDVSAKPDHRVRGWLNELETEAVVSRTRLKRSLKDGGILRPDAKLNQRCALSEPEKAHYSIMLMCRNARPPRSSYNAWRDRADTDRDPPASLSSTCDGPLATPAAPSGAKGSPPRKTFLPT
ncbi:hypothetical protein GCM10009854_47710 [Saccharopolyspora halophila]|uniref:Uncharacterized protein n=1 Tax=Saccharopolyspora halophila TaxID=405551 RepID=A0ABN3GVU6_9PSEU